MSRTVRPDKGNARSSGYARNDDDWYVEPPWAVDDLFDVEPFEGAIWDPSCGRGTIPVIASRRGHPAIGTDLVHRTAHMSRGGEDFLAYRSALAPNIVSNPPFGIIEHWIEHSLRLDHVRKVAVFARLALLEGIERGRWLQRSPLSRIWVFSGRVPCPPGQDAPAMDAWLRHTVKGGFVAYAWFVWTTGYTAEPVAGFIPRLRGAGDLLTP